MFKGVKIDLITIYLTNTPIITNLPCIKMNVYATRSLILSELEKIICNCKGALPGSKCHNLLI